VPEIVRKANASTKLQHRSVIVILSKALKRNAKDEPKLSNFSDCRLTEVRKMIRDPSLRSG